jgi:hypothetical protein
MAGDVSKNLVRQLLGRRRKARVDRRVDCDVGRRSHVVDVVAGTAVVTTEEEEQPYSESSGQSSHVMPPASAAPPLMKRMSAANASLRQRSSNSS